MEHIENRMKVLLISTSECQGGGAIAARRLLDALSRQGVDAAMLVRDRQTDDARVVQVGRMWPKWAERLAILPRCGFRRDRLWQADIANAGIDVTQTRAFREADVIHLHWVNQGMLSLPGIEEILRSGKRVVWTMHDEWPYLGVCHYRGACQEQTCRHCALLSGRLPYIIHARKRAMYAAAERLTFVGCSQWITEEARRAMPDADVRHINNCVPPSLFHPASMAEARRSLGLPEDKRLLLFCSQKVTDPRKGIRYLSQALQLLATDDIHLVIVGRGSEQIALPASLGVSRLGSVSQQQMPVLYNAVDAFLTPSLQDNLPNTIAEAMSCGTPCIGFRVGGIPEMIAHLRDGYVASYCDSADLAEGIRYVLAHDLRAAARAHAAAAYDEAQVARSYINLYQSK